MLNLKWRLYWLLTTEKLLMLGHLSTWKEQVGMLVSLMWIDNMLDNFVFAQAQYSHFFPLSLSLSLSLSLFLQFQFLMIVIRLSSISWENCVTFYVVWRAKSMKL